MASRNAEPVGEGQISRWPLAVARLYVGVVFLWAGVEQLRDGAQWTAPGQSWAAALHQQLTEWAPHAAVWYHGVLTQLLLPHTDVIAAPLAWLHILIGVALVLGVATRLAAGIALALLFNYMAASGHRPYGEWDAPAYAALALTLGLGAAGRTLGADVILKRRWPRVPLW